MPSLILMVSCSKLPHSYRRNFFAHFMALNAVVFARFIVFNAVDSLDTEILISQPVPCKNWSILHKKHD